MSTAVCRHGARSRSLSRWERAKARVSRPSRGAFTLLELLVAMALTLLLVYGMAEFYSYVGDTVRDGRAIVEMGSDIRNAVRQMREDLSSVTVQPRPPIDPSRGAGHLEIVEGFQSDADVDGDGTREATINGGTMMGDLDDILSMTIRSSAGPFVGRRYNTATSQYENIESHLAEVVWFTTFRDLNNNGSWQPDEPRFLVRRQLLIRPDLTTLGTPALGQNENFFHHNDISARPTSAGGWIANSLSDLTQRENRFIHLNLQQLNRNGLRAAEANPPIPNPNAAAYMPNPVWLMVNVGGRPNNLISNNQMSVDQYTLQRTQDPNTGVVTDYTGEDLVLPNLLAFDVRVYDPTARLYADDATVADALAALQPGDPGYVEAYNLNPNNPVGFGAYVDLFYNRATGFTLPAGFSRFSDAPRANSNSYFPDGLNTTVIANYDTWSTYYERDGYDQYADGKTDTAFDGQDNTPFTNGVDDSGEFETSPPYLTPLRGIQVRIRMYEPGTRQTRQATIVQDF